MRTAVMLLILSMFYVTPVTATDLYGRVDSFSIGNIYPNYFPVYYSEAGKWIVDVYDYEVSDVDKFTESIQSSLRKIKLKPFPALRDGHYIMPSIFISPVKMQQENCPGIMRAWYDGPFNTVVISTYAIANYDEGIIDYSVAHEIGHWVWDNVASEDSIKEYREMAGNIKNQDREMMNKYKLDEERVLQEWFADDFAQYACLVQTDPAKDGYSPFGGSHAHDEELEKYFSKYRDPAIGCEPGRQHEVFVIEN
ncbi:MAG: hypothetical protein M1489_06870 [Firmicutes bacterium]|nr:hypothetical protein [Bacillota bacterium]